MSLNVTIGTQTCKALLDTGCSESLIFKSCYENLDSEQQHSSSNVCNREIKGIAQTPIRILGEVVVDLQVHDSAFKDCTLYKVDQTDKEYDLLLGYDFLKKFGLTLYPAHSMIERTHSDGRCWQLYLDPKGNHRRILLGYDLYSRDSAKLSGKDPIKVRTTWNREVVLKNKEIQEDYFIDGLQADYRVQRVAQVYSGIMDERNQFVLVSPLPGNDKKRIRNIQVGDRLGKVYTVIYQNELDQANVYVGAAQVTTDQQQSSEPEWSSAWLEKETDIGETSMSFQTRVKIHKMLQKRKEALSQGNDDFRISSLPSFKIVLKDETPICQRTRHFSKPIEDEIERQCEELEKMQIIEESESPWNTPLVPIRKPDGTLRICLDYRKLNEVTIKNKFPMRLISDLVYNMHGMKVFTKLDLVRGYYQMPLDEESRPFTAFSTTKKHYQFRALSFGLANAPAAFQHAMNVTLKDFPPENVVDFIDDILIMGKSFEESLPIVDKVLETLEKVGIKVKLSKCHWFKDEVEFLGHKVSGLGIRKAEKYIEKVRNFPKPTTVRELKSFLGLVEF